MKVLIKDMKDDSWFRRFLDAAVPAVLALIVLADIVTRRVTWWTAAFAVLIAVDVALKVWKKRYVKRRTPPYRQGV